jgi:hypothetical protein
MLTLHRRRRIGETITGLPAHQVNWRAANDPRVDDTFDAARGMVNGVALGLGLWALIGFVWWVVHLLATGA